MMRPIWVALDTPKLDRALALAEQVRSHVGGLKLGLEFFCAEGIGGVQELAALGLPIFLDLKLHDIPNTVSKAIAALRVVKPAILTVHAAGGRAMLEDAKAAAPRGTKVVAVTMLTSLDADDLSATGVVGGANDHVLRLVELARASGVDGVVCSGAEVEAVRAHWPEGFLVVPGVRPDTATTADQKRVVTPRTAMAAGASIIVVGRPITSASNPADAARAIMESL